MKISFILPCYNVARYIGQCLDSLEQQDIPSSEYEVICVDDCSTDGTVDIIRKYQSRYPNIILLCHSENKTAGGARNTGISHAKGSFIWFVDPDDLIVPNCLGELYSYVTEVDTDILMFNFEAANEKLEKQKEYNVFCDSDISSGQDFACRYFPGRLAELCIIFRCLFKTRFLKEKKLEYPIMRKAQDVAFLWKVLLVAERVASINGIYYVNRGNPYSVAHRSKEANVAFSERILFANEIDKMLNNATAIQIKPEIAQEMSKALRWCVNSNLSLLSKMSDDELGKYYDKIVSHKDIVNRLKRFMNRKSRLIYSVFEGKMFWISKVKLLSKVLSK